MKEWLRYFQENREHRLKVPPDQVFAPEATLRGPLIRSLRRFQLGESGEGRHLRQFAASTGDRVYEQCVELFVKEEQDHARMTARILHGLGAPLLRRHWSNNCFVLLRRGFGLEEELLTLLVPEMIAQRFFRALYDGTTDAGLRAVFAQIIHDEDGHVAFHTDFLRRRLAALPLARRVLLRAGWRLIFRAAGLAVILDHRSVLRAVGIPRAAFWWDCGLIFDEVAANLFRFSGEGAFRFTFPAAKA
jgi:hypothetical protein